MRLFSEILRDSSHFPALRVSVSHKLIRLADTEVSAFPDMDGCSCAIPVTKRNFKKPNKVLLLGRNARKAYAALWKLKWWQTILFELVTSKPNCTDSFGFFLKGTKVVRGNFSAMDVSGDFFAWTVFSVPGLVENGLFNFEILFWVLMKVENVLLTEVCFPNSYGVEVGCILAQSFPFLVTSYGSDTQVKCVFTDWTFVKVQGAVRQCGHP